jgi:PAS domain S-box-containing protein
MYAKEYNEKIIENLIYTVIVLDENGNIKKINRALEDLLGYTQKDLLGQPMSKIFSEKFANERWKQLEKENKLEDFPVELIANNGVKKKLLFTGALMRDSGGKITGLIGTIKNFNK